jgi:hypothetical protein
MDEKAPEQYKKRKLVGWKAVYTDGSEYNSILYTWEEIPQRGFAALKKFFQIFDDNGDLIQMPDGSFYFSETKVGDDLYILDDDLRDAVFIPHEIKIGEWMTDEDFHPLYDNLRNDSEIITVMI